MNESRRSAGRAAHGPSLDATRPRKQPLPERSPKSPHEDPTAPDRVAAILASTSYRTADRDPEFLAWDAVRGIRLEIDYQKAELLLERYGVKHTVVVFGSTRLAEPRAAASKDSCGSSPPATRPDAPPTPDRTHPAGSPKSRNQPNRRTSPTPPPQPH